METGALADGAFHPDAAAVGVDDMPRDSESQAGAAGLARSGGVHTIETLENAFEVGFRNADA